MRRQSPRITDSVDQRRAELVRGAGGEQAHAHDVLLLGGALAQVGQLGVARAQVAADARDEDAPAGRRSSAKQISMPCDVEREQPRSWSRRQRERPVEHGQARRSTGW